MALDLDRLRQEWEEADAAAVTLSAEYQGRIDAEVTAKWQELKAEYSDRLNEANQAAAGAQQAYLDAEAANALLDRPDADQVLSSPAMQGDGAERLRAAYEAARSE